jgi:23S rRNA (adenine2503-C2)-methyltransferase
MKTAAGKVKKAAVTARPSVKEMDFAEFQGLLDSWNEPAFCAGQVLRWIYQRDAAGFDVMTDIKKALRQRLAGALDFDDPVVDRELTSADGTRKFSLKLRDGRRTESVIIFDGRRRTLCLSTQVGCRRACRICATGRMGFVRDLTSGEILNQIIFANRVLGRTQRLTHLVFMGMGEPMDNLENVLAALARIHHENGVGLGPGRVTVSTIGIVEGIKRLSCEGRGEGLAVSLQGGDQKTRTRLVPAARHADIGAVVREAARYARKIRGKVTFEYVMVKGINCSPDQARKLVRLLHGVPAKLNLIPYNDFSGGGFSAPSKAEIDAFVKVLLKSAVIITRRRTKGRDIAAACGQLAIQA